MAILNFIGFPKKIKEKKYFETSSIDTTPIENRNLAREASQNYIKCISALFLKYYFSLYINYSKYFFVSFKNV